MTLENMESMLGANIVPHLLPNNDIQSKQSLVKRVQMAVNAAMMKTTISPKEGGISKSQSNREEQE